MRYREQLKYSWNYNWGIFRDIWDMFTLHRKYWWVVLAFAVICVFPNALCGCAPDIPYYITTPAPGFEMCLGDELATSYYYSRTKNSVSTISVWHCRQWTSKTMGTTPSLPAVLSYHWVTSEGYKPTAGVMGLVSAGLLLVAYLREEK